MTGLEPATSASQMQNTTNCATSIYCGNKRIRTYSALKQQIYSLPRLSNFGVFPLPFLIVSWNLVESNHVLRIFSPSHTPSLPKFQITVPGVGVEPTMISPPDPKSDRYTNSRTQALLIKRKASHSKRIPFRTIGFQDRCSDLATLPSIVYMGFHKSI